MSEPAPGQPRRSLPPLEIDAMAGDPIAQFSEWYELARREVPLAEAMTLATVDEGCEPDARMVLLKGFGAAGFRFFTNYESDKAIQIETRPGAALVVYWRELDRQVRVRGNLSRLSEEDSDAYFASRPRESRLGALASPQSRAIERSELEARFAAADRDYPGEEIPRPRHWGGYVLEPRSIEFWQGRTGRLHDRIAYAREGEDWTVRRLAP